MTLEKDNPFKDTQDADTTFGQPASNAYDSAAMTRRMNKELPSPPAHVPLPENPYGPLVLQVFQQMAIHSHSHSRSSKRGTPKCKSPESTPDTAIRHLKPRNTPHTPLRTTGLGIVTQDEDETPTSQSGRSTRNNYIHTPRSRFGHDGDPEDYDIGLSSTIDNLLPAPRSTTPKHPMPLSTFSSRGGDTAMSTLERHCPKLAEESQMERQETINGFGDQPLELKEGVAVTEEAVALHVPDIITHA